MNNNYQNNNYQQPNNYQQNNNYQQPNYQNNYQPNYQNNYQQPNYQNFHHNPEPPVSEGIKAMVFGILSIVLCSIPIIGIIFAAIARSKAANISRTYPESAAAKFAKAGRITGNVGLGLSIFYLVFWAIYIIYFVALFSLLL